jgi:hypothetical protein
MYINFADVGQSGDIVRREGENYRSCLKELEVAREWR